MKQSAWLSHILQAVPVPAFIWDSMATKSSNVPKRHLCPTKTSCHTSTWHYFLTDVIYQSYSRLQFGLSVLKKKQHTCLPCSCQSLTQVWPYCCFLRLEWLAERTAVLDLLFSKWQKIWYRDTQEFSFAFWPLSRGHLINTEKRRGKYIFFLVFECITGKY